MLCDLLNPKVMLTFLSLIPQAMDPNAAPLPQAAVLSAVTVGVFAVFWVIVVPSARQLGTAVEQAQDPRGVRAGLWDRSHRDWRRQFSLPESHVTDSSSRVPEADEVPFDDVLQPGHASSDVQTTRMISASSAASNSARPAGEADEAAGVLPGPFEVLVP